MMCVWTRESRWTNDGTNEWTRYTCSEVPSIRSLAHSVVASSCYTIRPNVCVDSVAAAAVEVLSLVLNKSCIIERIRAGHCKTTCAFSRPVSRLNKIGKNPNIMGQREETNSLNTESKTISAVVNALAAEADQENNLR